MRISDLCFSSRVRHSVVASHRHRSWCLCSILIVGCQHAADLTSL